jgi:hypothetical protein
MFESAFCIELGRGFIRRHQFGRDMWPDAASETFRGPARII